MELNRLLSSRPRLGLLLSPLRLHLIALSSAGTMIKNWSCCRELALFLTATFNHWSVRPGDFSSFVPLSPVCARSCFSNKVGRFMPWKLMVARAALRIARTVRPYHVVSITEMSDERSAGCIHTFQLHFYEGRCGDGTACNWMYSYWLSKKWLQCWWDGTAAIDLTTRNANLSQHEITFSIVWSMRKLLFWFFHISIGIDSILNNLIKIY